MTSPTPPKSERTLILARHAKAEHSLGKPDHDRDLTPRGRSDARAIGVWLNDTSRPVVVDVVLCSTSERARQTLDSLLAAGARAHDVRFDERIYDGSAAGLLDLLRETPDAADTVMMIGHAPGIPVLATALARNDTGLTDTIDRLSLGFPTSALAVLTFEGPWAALAPETANLADFVITAGEPVAAMPARRDRGSGPGAPP